MAVSSVIGSACETRRNASDAERCALAMATSPARTKRGTTELRRTLCVLRVLLRMRRDMTLELNLFEIVHLLVEVPLLNQCLELGRNLAHFERTPAWTNLNGCQAETLALSTFVNWFGVLLDFLHRLPEPVETSESQESDIWLDLNQSHWITTERTL